MEYHHQNPLVAHCSPADLLALGFEGVAVEGVEVAPIGPVVAGRLVAGRLVAGVAADSAEHIAAAADVGRLAVAGVAVVLQPAAADRRLEVRRQAFA